jgi:hypothetical protein
LVQTIEEFDYISEVHAVAEDDVSVRLNQCQGDKEDKVV